MTKAERIERYGLERYEQLVERIKARQKERYHNDPEFREAEKASQCKRYATNTNYREAKKARSNTYHKDHYANDLNYRLSEKIRTRTLYVKDGRIDLIENYELATKDNLDGWHIHHRLELHPDCTVRFTRQSLIKLNLYYDRPPSELIWLRETEHNQIHHKGKVKK